MPWAVYVNVCATTCRMPDRRTHFQRVHGRQREKEREKSPVQLKLAKKFPYFPIRRRGGEGRRVGGEGRTPHCTGSELNSVRDGEWKPQFLLGLPFKSHIFI